MIRSVKTRVKCRACARGQIVAEAEYVITGVGDTGGEWSITFHCSNCEVLVRCPPGRPEMAEQIKKDLKKKYGRPPEPFEVPSTLVSGQIRRELRRMSLDKCDLKTAKPKTAKPRRTIPFPQFPQ